MMWILPFRGEVINMLGNGAKLNGSLYQNVATLIQWLTIMRNNVVYTWVEDWYYECSIARDVILFQVNYSSHKIALSDIVTINIHNTPMLSSPIINKITIIYKHTYMLFISLHSTHSQLPKPGSLCQYKIITSTNNYPQTQH